MFNIEKVRKDFPILNRKIKNKPLIYFDNAATSQTPIQVIDSISNYYKNYNANIHRGVHTLSQEATDAYEKARKKVQLYFNARNSYEIIFTPGTTHSINLVASGYEKLLKKGDEIIISVMEHHSNIVPWQLLCNSVGAKLTIIPLDENEKLDMDKYEKLLSPRTKLVCVNHVSNALGSINPIANIVKMAHNIGAKVLVDGAQAAPHLLIDFQFLNIDYYTVSAHKMYGPMGIGILYGKEELLEMLPPYQGGGEMISEVTFEKTTYADLPHKFEAGTPNVSGAIAFGVALDYINNLGKECVLNYEKELLKYVTKNILPIENLRIYGDVSNKTPVISFNIKGVHSYDLGAILDNMSIAVRTGHHCAQPVMDYLKTLGTTRISFAVYNTKKEIDYFLESLEKALKMLL